MKAPHPGTEKNIRYPEIPVKPLPNDLQVLSVSDAHLPRISMMLLFPVGRVFSPNHNLALIPLALELIKSGTETRSARQIADFVDQWAIEYDSSIMMEHSALSIDVLADYLEPALEFLADILLRPSWPDEELQKVKVRWQSHLIAQRSQPGFLADERTFGAIYQNHPYSKVSLTPQHLEEAASEAISDIYQRHFVPGGAYLLLAGPVELDQAAERAQKFFGKWKKQPVPEVSYPQLSEIEGPLISLVHRPYSVQSKIVVALRALPAAHPDDAVLKVTNQILGGGASARLFLNLREEKGYTYGAYSRVRSYRHDGLLLAGASVRTDTTLESIRETLKELKQMCQRPPDESELKRSQSELTGAFVRQMQTPASIGRLELNRRLYGFPHNFYSDFIPRIRSVTGEQVLEMARLLFDPERVVITVVGDRESVEEDLRQLGELQVYDADGNRI